MLDLLDLYATGKDWYQYGITAGTLMQQAYKIGGLKLKSKDDLHIYEFYQGYAETDLFQFLVDSEAMYNNMQDVGTWLNGMIEGALTDTDKWGKVHELSHLFLEGAESLGEIGCLSEESKFLFEEEGNCLQTLRPNFSNSDFDSHWANAE
jgi:hypothetical protein